MTDRELIAKLEGFLAANFDRGLTPAQIEEALKMMREPTTDPYPVYPSPVFPSIYDDQPLPWWRNPVWSSDRTAPIAEAELVYNYTKRRSQEIQEGKQ
jgi:hypothetical protein